jgi:NAD(P)-dependent dehydrogenase (short-subunit alcohol dehydrogenase family)
LQQIRYIVGMAVFLASADATGMTGQSMQMDGGMVLC